MRKYQLIWSILALLLFAVTGCGGEGGNAPATGTIPVQVTETDFHITSSVINFLPGKTYHFIVSNQGKVEHEFMLMPKSEGSMSGMPMENMDKLALASIREIEPGETKTVDYTFLPSAAASHPEMACYFPGHYEAGMKLGVTVNA